MNIKLKNLRSAEEDLGKFLGNIVVTSELATSICGDEVNDAYLEYVIQLNSKVKHAPNAEVVCTHELRLHFPWSSGVGASEQRYWWTPKTLSYFFNTICTTSYLFPSRSNTSGRLMPHQMAPA